MLFLDLSDVEFYKTSHTNACSTPQLLRLSAARSTAACDAGDKSLNTAAIKFHSAELNKPVAHTSVWGSSMDCITHLK